MGGVAGALAAIALLLLVVGVPVPLGLARPLLEKRAGDALGSPVELGSLQLVLGIHPGLRLGSVRVAHPEPSRPEILTLERLQLKLDPVALLRKRLRLVEVAVRGVVVRADPTALPEAGTGAEAPEREPAAAPLGGWSLDVDSLEVEAVDVAYASLAGEIVRARLDRLDAALRWDESTEIRARGTYDAVPLALEVEAGSIASLLAEPEAWPLSLALRLAEAEARLRLELAVRPGWLRLNDIQGRGGEGAELAGWLALENADGRPRIRGELRVGAIDLSPYLEPAEGGGTSPAGEIALAEPPSSEATAEAAIPARGAPPEAPVLATALLDTLETFDTDLALSIERLSGVGPPLEDVAIAVAVAGGALDFPVSLRAAGIPLEGALGLDRRNGELHAALALRASGPFRVDELGAYLAPGAGWQGDFRELRIDGEGTGGSLRELLVSLRTSLVARGAELSYGFESPVPVGVEHLEVDLEERGPFTVQARAELLGEPLRLDLSAGSVEALLDGAGWPLRLAATGAGTDLELQGEARGSLALGTFEAAVELRVEGEKLGRLEPWLGALPFPDAPYALRARVERAPGRIRATLEEMRLGETTLTGEVGVEQRGGRRLARVDLHVDEIDLSKLSKEAPEPTDAAPSATPADPGIALDVPILPGGIHLEDADLSLSFDRLRLARVELTDFRFRGGIRDGYLNRSPFRFRTADAAFEGALSMDLREMPHEASLEFGARDLDVGSMLERLGIAEGLKASASRVEIRVDGRGSTLLDALDGSELVAGIEDARWTLTDAASGAELPLLLDGAELRAGGEGSIQLLATGSVEGAPLGLEIRTAPLSLVRDPPDRLPLRLRAEAAGAALELETSFELPIREQDLDARLRVSGERLDQLASLLRYELPPVGPYRLDARVQVTPSAYLLSDLDLRVARSELRGQGSLRTAGERPRIDVELSSDRVQLDDFTARGQDAARPETAGVEAAEQRGEPVPPLSPEGLLRFDGRLAVRVERVLSGEDELGNGDLVVTLQDGRLRVDPLDLDLPGGRFLLEMEYAYSGSDASARLRALSERLDYGILARRVDPESEMEGSLTLDLDIAGRAPIGEDLLAHASGRLDFAAFPENIGADVIDLWVTGLLRALLPILDPRPRSMVNCVVARFDLSDGFMTEKALLLDTTRMVVRGSAALDFEERRLEAVFRPQPKKPAIFALQTPVAVRGSFRDPRIGVAPEEALRTFVRLATSVVVAPIRRIFGRPLPADGVATCRAAWETGREGIGRAVADAD